MSPTGHGADGAGAIRVNTYGMAPGFRFDEHAHDEHQLAWAAAGVLVATAAGHTWVLPPTRALWIPAGTPHQILASGRSEMRAAYLRPDSCPIMWPEPQPVAAGPLLAALIHHLADDEIDATRRARAEGVVFDLLEPAAVVEISAPRPADPRAADVADALLSDPADQRNLREWGHAVGASSRTLARAFVTDTGMSFGTWRTATRLQASLPRLAAGESISKVAHHVGYGTSSAFVAAFRRYTGSTPGAYFRNGK